MVTSNNCQGFSWTRWQAASLSKRWGTHLSLAAVVGAFVFSSNEKDVLSLKVMNVLKYDSDTAGDYKLVSMLLRYSLGEAQRIQGHGGNVHLDSA